MDDLVALSPRIVAPRAVHPWPQNKSAGRIPLPNFPARRQSAIRLAALVAVTVALRHFGLPSRPIIAAENETVRKVIPTHRGVSSGRYEIKVAWRIAET